MATTMPARRVYFLSDLHLGAACHADTRERERQVVAWLQSIADDASHIYLLGDVIDYWFEYRSVVPRGYVRFLGQLAMMADAGVKITWIKGNHDLWITDYLPAELGIEVVDGPIEREILGRRFFMEHGDGMGAKSWSFNLLRHLFRSKTARRLFSAIHPRWTVGFAHRWSAGSRKAGGKIARGDIDRAVVALENASRTYLAGHPGIDFFIYGHLHVALDRVIDRSTRMVLLGDWINRECYATFSPDEGLILHQTPRK